MCFSPGLPSVINCLLRQQCITPVGDALLGQLLRTRQIAPRLAVCRQTSSANTQISQFNISWASLKVVDRVAVNLGLALQPARVIPVWANNPVFRRNRRVGAVLVWRVRRAGLRRVLNASHSPFGPCVLSSFGGEVQIVSAQRVLVNHSWVGSARGAGIGDVAIRLFTRKNLCKRRCSPNQ